MINKFEGIGILASIGFMAGALFLLNMETNNIFSTKNTQDIAPVAAVVASNDGTDEPLLTDVLADSFDESGKLTNMIIDDVVLGTGDPILEGDTVSVHYIGTLQNGQQFDNSYLKGVPFEFTVGEGRVIAGWEKGLVGMKVGGQRILVIPPELAYGNDGVGPIPGNATLVFAVELLDIK